MKTIMSPPKKIRSVMTIGLLIFMTTVLNGQVIRPYNKIFSDNLRGGHTIIGNTLSAIYTTGSGSTGTVDLLKMNDFSTSGLGNYTYGRTSTYGNDNSNIQLVDIDGDVLTTNSSSAVLSLPAGTNTIKFARLYWGGRITGGMGGSNNINIRTVKFKFNTEDYQTVVALPAAVDKAFITGSGVDSTYQAYFDVTAFIKTRVNGTYTLANITADVGSHSGGGMFAGWAMVLVYQNELLPYSSVRVYDGYLQVFNNGSPITQSIQLDGLDAPDAFALPSDAYMSTVSWEGDANLAASNINPNGDYVKVNDVAVSNNVNPVTNFWNGTISKNGTLLSNKNPDFNNQMGIDIDEVEVGVGYGILPDDTHVHIEFGTEADQYFPSIFAFTMITKPPVVALDKYVKDTASGNAPWQIPNDTLNPNEILTYTIAGKNLGIGHALNCVIADTIPGSLTYRNGSLKINLPTPGGHEGFQTDAADDDYAFKGNLNEKDFVVFYIGEGATSTTGGLLHPGDSFSVQFQCIVPPTASTINYVTNTARITGTEEDGVTPFVDDGSAVIGPPVIPLLIKMTVLSVVQVKENALLSWMTSFESKNSHFDVERSYDGIDFMLAGTVKSNGNSYRNVNYSFTDPIDTKYAIIYYRLKIVNDDNQAMYSKVMALRINQPVVLSNFSVYPNPFTDQVKIAIAALNETPLTILIKNAAGQQQGVFHITLQTGSNIVVLAKLDYLLPGIYYVEIVSPTGRLTQKIMKK